MLFFKETKRDKTKIRFETIREIKDFLKSKIFTIPNHKGVFLFEDDTYAILPGNVGLFLKRNDIVWPKIRPKHTYSLFQYEWNFVFITHNHEIYPDENEFSISVNHNQNSIYTVTFKSIAGKTERLTLVSE